jgi:AcrR family transcriptional regulator
MYKICKTEQSAARQRELEYGLLSAMEVVRYEDITISDLCARMNIPRKSFYRYFSSKDGALHALLDHTLLEYEGFVLECEMSGARTLVTDLELFFRFWIRHRALLDVLERSGMSGLLIERAITHALSDEVMPKRFLSREVVEMQQQIVMFVLCGLMSMVLTWYKSGFEKSPKHMASIAERLLSQPLFPNINSIM